MPSKMDRYTTLFLFLSALLYIPRGTNATAQDVGTVCGSSDTCIDTNAECDENEACDCKSGFTADGTTCKTDLGSNCASSSSCFDANAACTGDSKPCVCKNGFTKHEQKCKTDLGSNCASSSSCFDANAACTGDSKPCVCKNGFTEHEKKCKTVLGGVCTVTEGCSGGDNVECSSTGTTICKCKTEFINNGVGTCTSNTCATDPSQCDAMLNTECTEKKCVCKSGFEPGKTVGPQYGSCVAKATENKENGSGQLLFSGGLLLLTTFVMMM